MGIIQAIKDAIKKHKKYDPLDFNTEYLDKWRDAMKEEFQDRADKFATAYDEEIKKTKKEL